MYFIVHAAFVRIKLMMMIMGYDVLWSFYDFFCLFIFSISITVNAENSKIYVVRFVFKTITCRNH